MRHLDTNIVIPYLNGDQDIAKRLKTYSPDVSISTLVLGELLYGARASTDITKNLQRIEEFLEVVKVVDFDQSSANIYSHLRIELREKGKPTGELDLLIASVAVAHNAILVTHNTKHFENIDGLILEDWLRS